MLCNLRWCHIHPLTRSLCRPPWLPIPDNSGKPAVQMALLGHIRPKFPPTTCRPGLHRIGPPWTTWYAVLVTKEGNPWCQHPCYYQLIDDNFGVTFDGLSWRMQDLVQRVRSALHLWDWGIVSCLSLMFLPGCNIRTELCEVSRIVPCVQVTLVAAECSHIHWYTESRCRGNPAVDDHWGLPVHPSRCIQRFDAYTLPEIRCSAIRWNIQKQIIQLYNEVALCIVSSLWAKQGKPETCPS